MEDFHAAVRQAVEWLKERRIDVILVGLRYTHSMARDQHYQAIREAIQIIAKEQSVLRMVATRLRRRWKGLGESKTCR